MNRITDINRILLTACIAMYFGTGWSLVLSSLPIRPQLTVSHYYLQFVPQVPLNNEMSAEITDPHELDSLPGALIPRDKNFPDYYSFLYSRTTAPQ
jgi:hypothetical protein